MGVVYDRDMNIDSSRVFRGEMLNNLVEKDVNGRYAFFVKEADAGLNNINVAWVEYSTWECSHQVVSEVGEVVEDENTHQVSVTWGMSSYAGEYGV